MKSIMRGMEIGELAELIDKLLKREDCDVRLVNKNYILDRDGITSYMPSVVASALSDDMDDRWYVVGADDMRHPDPLDIVDIDDIIDLAEQELTEETVAEALAEYCARESGEDEEDEEEEEERELRVERDHGRLYVTDGETRVDKGGWEEEDWDQADCGSEEEAREWIREAEEKALADEFPEADADEIKEIAEELASCVNINVELVDVSVDIYEALLVDKDLRLKYAPDAEREYMSPNSRYAVESYRESGELPCVQRRIAEHLEYLCRERGCDMIAAIDNGSTAVYYSYYEDKWKCVKTDVDVLADGAAEGW